MTVPASISPNQSQIQTAVVAFLNDVLSGFSPAPAVVEAMDNRVAEPATTNFVVMTTLGMDRLSTNVDSYQDVAFTASIAASVLTVSAVAFGVIKVGAQLFGVNVAATRITSQLTGTPGGVGTYAIDTSQAVSSEKMSAGLKVLQISSILRMQLDFHSADNSAANDMAMTVAAALRDDYGVSFFAALPAPQNAVAPIEADHPQMRPFVNDQSQYEFRLVSDARFQVNQTIAVPQQFADALAVELVEIDAAYPP